ncbi:exodeoxyribonuclease III [Corynebacterium aquilae]|uniref:Exodeoxyribonuclease III n=1 Tax=Corynebacterium aquilae DSM 44791 TaxID=1431546 RepID=A0A1L7CIC4_9CORY|nr:exodeoxyribonuclease III [Corynebacterium aquilae]APT85523.1 exodeoxyribonuclease III [Corynebacterium aquilae DSM 44791]
MRIATFNINSVRARVDRVLDVLERHDLDVLALQETKASEKNFPYAAFEQAGYEVAHVGTGQWNGVAIVSRVGIEDVWEQFPGQPGFHKDPTKEQAVEPRCVSAVCGGVRVMSLYVPNGREVADPHYTYKLRWLDVLSHVVRDELASHPDRPLLLVGDFNIAPRDEDVWSMEFFADKTHVTEPERAAFERLLDAGLYEVTRKFTPGEYTYFDYTAGRFPNREGMRIDFQLASKQLARTVQAVTIDIKERQGKGASDHLPVIVDYTWPKTSDEDVR